MKKNMKRIAALLVCICMVVSTLTGKDNTISAAENDASATVREEVSVNDKPEISSVRYRIKVKDKSKILKGHRAEVYYSRVVLKGNSEAIKKINQSIKQDMNDFLLPNRVKGTYELTKQTAKTQAKYPFEWFADSKVTYNKNGIISIRVTTSSYTGGVRNIDRYGLTYDLNTGEKLTLADVGKGSVSKIKKNVKKKVKTGQKKHCNDYNKQVMKDYKVRTSAFYLEPKKRAVVCFKPYELGLGTYTEVVIKSKYK